MKVAVAFLLVLCTVIASCSGNGKGAKAKEAHLKKKLHQKIFHHHHHHPPQYHPHQHHHPNHYHHHHHHHHHPHHPPPHHSHHHVYKKHAHHHQHHHHHHHYHNPFKHHLHGHHHPHHHPHKKPFHHTHPHHEHHQQHKHHIHQHHHSSKRSDITRAPVELPDKLKLHVQIKDSQATKRQSLPALLANLGEHLMKLGTSLTPKKSQMETPVTSIDTPDNEGDVRNAVPEPKPSTTDSPAVHDSSSTTTTPQTDTQRKKISISDVQALLHHALDEARTNELGSGFSGHGEGEETDATTTNVVTKTDSATAANRRNETFPEPEIYGPLESQEYDASEKQKESSNNYTLEEIAAQSFQTENTEHKDLSKDSRSNDAKKDKSSVHDDERKNNESEKNGLAGDAVGQHEKIHENGNQTEALNLTLQALGDPKSSDAMNSTLEDEESQNDRKVSKPEGAGKSVTGESKDDNKDEEEMDNNEVSGSGEEPLAEIKENTERQTTADDKMSQGGSGVGQLSDKPIQEEEENSSAQISDQSGIETTEGHQENERETKPLIKESANSLDESKKPVPEGNIEQQTVVNVEGSHIMANQSEDLFQPGSSEDTEPKKGNIVLEDNKQIDQSDSYESERPVSLEEPSRSEATSKDTQASQADFSEPSRSKPATNLEKIFQTKDKEPNTQLEVKKEQSNQRDHPALNEIDNGSGASFSSQETIEDNDAPQTEQSRTDLDGFAEGPKTPAILDDLAEPSSPSGGEPRVVNVEGSQLNDLHEDVSQETGPDDASDEIPVYTLSSPVGDDSFASDDSNLPAPTSSVTTSSVNFIDSGAGMAPGYVDSSSLSEGYNTYSTQDPSSQGAYNSFSQSAGLQRDMLDDPVQESLETTAVDSKSS